ncbi:MAG: signal recognition particle-docking protein FtsY [Ignavibacteria bacterium RBG_16_34_14]|nr:MAG: signal recognition particle-docking protein FtsY [Ignavibacteria bacterium RBG_16_34_14]
MSLFDNINFKKLKDGLTKTRNKLFNSITETISGKAVIDNATLDEIEEILITSDIGFDTTETIIENARKSLKNERDRSTINIVETVKKELSEVLKSNYAANGDDINKFKPYVFLIVGVNGVGKTTTIGKLAYNFNKAGLKVIIGAADTFRAAANEQLEIWAKRADVEIYQKEKGTDPSSVAFDAVKKAQKENFDIVLIDTAGRLHNKANLMEELGKLKRVLAKVVPYAPNETLLVLDGTTGQNAVLQAEEFKKVTNISGLIITKLDGTAKGGVVFQISSKLKIPVKYIGVGEAIDDLQTFDPDLFVSALFETN